MNPARDEPIDGERGDGATPASGRHWASITESTSVWGIWCLYLVNRLLGRGFFKALLVPVVGYYWMTNRLARRASLDFLRRVHTFSGAEAAGHPTPTLRHTFRHLLSFAETLLDKMLAIGGQYRFGDVRRDGEAVMLRRIASGGGGVIVTAHMGCLELCRVVAGHRQGLRLNVLVHTAHAARFNRMLQKLDPDSGLRLIQVTEISASTAMLLQEKVAAGEFVAIAGDRIPVEGSRTVTVPFLGAPARLPIGPYALASLLNCPLYAMGCVREGAGHLLRFTELASEVVLPRATRQAALTAYASRYADWLVALVVASPYDWFNFYDFWADGPAPRGR